MMAMLGRVSQWRFLLVFLIWCGSVNSSQLGPENCTATELLDKPQPSLEFLYVPTGTVCFECIIDGELATGAMFQIDNNEVSSSVGTVVNGTLVVFDTESTFPSQGNVRCSDESGLYGASVIHELLKPPLIKGETTVSEGDTLHLTCDVSDSRPLPSIKWVYPGGQTFTRDLEISNIMRNMSGTYTCIATHTTFSDATMNISVHITILFNCEAVQSTELIIVNMTSTAMGSIATYQCRDGPADDVYTTQCTSAGVWDPHPLSLLNCTKPTDMSTTPGTNRTTGMEPTSTEPTTTDSDSSNGRADEELGAVLGVVLAVLLILCITTVVIALFALKRRACLRKLLLSYKNRGTGTSGELSQEDDSVELRATNPQYSPVHSVAQETTELNGQCSRVGNEPAEPFGQYSVVQKEAKRDVETSGKYSLDQAEPQQTTDSNVQYALVQKSPKQSKELLDLGQTNAQYTVVQKQTKEVPVPAEPQETAVHSGLEHPVVPVPLETDGMSMGWKREGVGCASSYDTLSPTPPPGLSHSPTTVKTIIYAEVGPHISPTPRPVNPLSDRVQYASLDHSAVIKKTPVTTPQGDPDSSVCLDQILIQLREVSPHWRRLGEAVGLTTLDEISRCVGGSESEAMVEVVDGWLAKLHPDKPTWREIADVVDTIGHHDLANSLRQVYVLGSLPIQVSDELPESLMIKEPAPPPPLPPREKEGGNLSPPPLPVRPLT